MVAFRSKRAHALALFLSITAISVGCRGQLTEVGCTAASDCSGQQVCDPSTNKCIQPEPANSGTNANPGNVNPNTSPNTAPNNTALNNSALVCDDQRTMCGDRCCPPGFDCAGGRCDCPTERFCDGICCAQGQACELGQCVDPCDGDRCGASLELCCTGEQLCINAQCEAPGQTCTFNEECADDQICDALIGACVSKPETVCEYRPPVGEFSPVIGCEWRPDPEGAHPERGDVVASPVVMNLVDEGEEDGFEIPEIAFVSFDRRSQGCCNAPSTLRIVSGKCDGDGVRTIASISEPPINNDVGIAAGDLDGDGVPELVAVTNKSRVRESDMKTIYYPEGMVAFKRGEDNETWEVLWHNETYPTNNIHVNGGPTLSLADLDGDGAPEVILGSVVLNGQDGELVWDGTAMTPDGEKRVGQGHNVFGPVSSVVDVDGDGLAEVFAGNTLYNYDGTVRWSFDYPGANSSCRFGASNPLDCDGYNGVVDFDGDLFPDLVSVRLGQVYVLDREGAELWSADVPVSDCARNEAGPPTIADFDGDGRPEIGTAGADFYVVTDIDCDVDDWEARGCYARKILWATPNMDCSSRSTASSVFDFEGDGAAEVVYVDEATFMILSGKDGSVLFSSDDHESNTRIELPVIADVDNDNNAEVIVASAWANRMAEEHGELGKSGLRIWQDSSDNWVRTRKVWNQHSYHVTNIAEDGTIPSPEPDNWRFAGLNNYRQNVQPSGLFDAPDLVVREVRTGDSRCLTNGALDIFVLIGNDGASSVPEGIDFTVTAVFSEEESLELFTVETRKPLLPGQTESFALDWSVPSEHQGKLFTIEVSVDSAMEHRECIEDNNSNSSAPTECTLAQ